MPLPACLPSEVQNKGSSYASQHHCHTHTHAAGPWLLLVATMPHAGHTGHACCLPTTHMPCLPSFLPLLLSAHHMMPRLRPFSMLLLPLLPVALLRLPPLLSGGRNGSLPTACLATPLPQPSRPACRLLPAMLPSPCLSMPAAYFSAFDGQASPAAAFPAMCTLNHACCQAPSTVFILSIACCPALHCLPVSSSCHRHVIIFHCRFDDDDDGSERTG